MSEWRPGLPSEPCVCDVRQRVGGQEFHVFRNVWVTRTTCMVDRPKLGDAVLSVVCRVPGFLGMVPIWPGACEWRPIPIPAGVAP